MAYMTVSYDGCQLDYYGRREFQEKHRYAVVGPGMEIIAIFVDPFAAMDYAERLEENRDAGNR